MLALPLAFYVCPQDFYLHSAESLSCAKARDYSYLACLDLIHESLSAFLLLDTPPIVLTESC